MRVPTFDEATVLAMGEQHPVVSALEYLLQEIGYRNVVGLSDLRAATVVAEAIRPDLVVVDVAMESLRRTDVLAKVRAAVSDGEALPIVVLTLDAAPETVQMAVTLGATDFLAKPTTAVELCVRTRNLLRIRSLHERLQHERALLEERIHERTWSLEESQLETLGRLARFTEYRDDATGQHTHRVGHLAGVLAKALALPDEDAELIEQAAPLHDVGKIAIPDRVLLKPGNLNADEVAIMRSHTEIAGRILAGSQFPVVQLAEQIALTHHERWDGAGYPGGMGADSVPLAGRIVAVADVYDALTHARPYRPAWSHRAALAEIERQRGRHFDPEVARAFLRVLERQPRWDVARDAALAAGPPLDIPAPWRIGVSERPARQLVVA